MTCIRRTFCELLPKSPVHIATPEGFIGPEDRPEPSPCPLDVHLNKSEG